MPGQLGGCFICQDAAILGSGKARQMRWRTTCKRSVHVTEPVLVFLLRVSAKAVLQLKVSCIAFADGSGLAKPVHVSLGDPGLMYFVEKIVFAQDLELISIITHFFLNYTIHKHKSFPFIQPSAFIYWFAKAHSNRRQRTVRSSAW